MRSAAFAVAVVAAVAACGTLVAASDEDVGGDAGVDSGDPVNGDAGPKILGEAGVYDGPPEEGGTSDASICPRGAPMIALAFGAQKFCIDATEVTNEAYGAFLAAKVPFTGQLAECSWNTNWAPNCTSPTKRAAQPVTCIDWCDAYAYCKWAGKRLCGLAGHGGQNVATTDFVDPKKSEWFAACSQGGLRSFSYGNVAKNGACPSNGSGVADVATSPGCVGGFDGLHEMSGNVGEWEGSCQGATAGAAGEEDPCRIRGGDDTDNYQDQNCGQDYATRRAARDPDTGFRCCADATPF
jgi:formylglycine-generating enzyme required for sulfatase activity